MEFRQTVLSIKSSTYLYCTIRTKSTASAQKKQYHKHKVIQRIRILNVFSARNWQITERYI